MTAVSLHDANLRLAELIRRLTPGEAITITENDTPVAYLVRVPAVPQRPPRPRPPVTGLPRAGRWRGKLVVPPDFKELLEELREYME